jgi:hypothetical protein
MPIGIRAIITSDKINAVFLPLLPPKMNKKTIINIQNKSLPYNE